MSEDDWRDQFTDDIAAEQLYMLDNEIDTDCIIKIYAENDSTEEVGSFKVHRHILQRASPVFSKMFNGDYLEKEKGVIDITDIKAQIMEHMIRCIYGEETFWRDDMTLEDLFELIMAANKYGITKLIKNLYSLLEEKFLSFRNVLGVKKYTNPFKDSIPVFKCIEKEIIEIIKKETAELLTLENTLEITEEDLIQIVNLETLSLDSELDLLNFVNNWANYQLKKAAEDNDDSPVVKKPRRKSKSTKSTENEKFNKDLRKLVDNVIPGLRFLTITNDMYCKDVHHYKWLTVEEKHSILKAIITKCNNDLPSYMSKSTNNRCVSHIFPIGSQFVESKPRTVSTLLFVVSTNVLLHNIQFESQVKFNHYGTDIDNYNEFLTVSIKSAYSNKEIMNHIFQNRVQYNSIIDIKFDKPCILSGNRYYYLTVETKINGEYAESRNFFNANSSLEIIKNNINVSCLVSRTNSLNITYRCLHPERIHSMKLTKM